MRFLSKYAAAFLALALGLQGTALGHPELLAQIAALSEEIALEPASSPLYLRRGALLRLHESWDAALADFETALRLDPRSADAELARITGLFDLSRTGEATRDLDRFVTQHPEHAAGRALRAEIRLKSDLAKEAAEDFRQEAALQPEPGPEPFINESQAWLAAGDAYTTRALQALDEGIRRIGPTVSLVRPAIVLDRRLQRWDSALARIAALESGSPRKESWIVLRAEVLEEAGRRAEANRAYEAALQAAALLPRRTGATIELCRKAETGYERTK